MKKAKQWIIITLVVLVVFGVFFYLWQNSRPKPIHYEVLTAELSDIQKTTIVTGKVEPRDEVAVKPQISGIISELYHQAGDMVKAGDAIAKIKVIPDMNQLANAESQVRLARFNLDNQRNIYERDSALYQQGIISAETLEKTRLTYSTCEEQFQAARDNLSITRDGVARKMDKQGFSNTIVKATISGTVLSVNVKVGNSVILSNTFTMVQPFVLLPT